MTAGGIVEAGVVGSQHRRGNSWSICWYQYFGMDTEFAVVAAAGTDAAVLVLSRTLAIVVVGLDILVVRADVAVPPALGIV